VSRQLSIAVATYERTALTIASFAQVHNDLRVRDIAISDDGSNADTITMLASSLQPFKKAHLLLNSQNKGSWENKRQAVILAQAEWVVLLDSDNVIGSDFLDALFAQSWDEDVLYIPTRGVPALDYVSYTGLVVDKNNIHQWLDQPAFQMALNTGNFFVHRQNHLFVSGRGVEESFASDGVYFIYRWLSSGRRVLFTPDLSYAHLVHAGHWMKTSVQSLLFADMLLSRMRSDTWEVLCAA
jgi:GT2 family glycosyltransferase